MGNGSVPAPAGRVRHRRSYDVEPRVSDKRYDYETCTAEHPEAGRRVSEFEELAKQGLPLFPDRRRTEYDPD